MKRFKRSGRKDKRYFSKHAKKTRAINASFAPRGGFRL